MSGGEAGRNAVGFPDVCIDASWRSTYQDLWYDPDLNEWRIQPVLGPRSFEAFQVGICKKLWGKAARHYEGDGLEEGFDHTVPFKLL